MARRGRRGRLRTPRPRSRRATVSAAGHAPGTCASLQRAVGVRIAPRRVRNLPGTVMATIRLGRCPRAGRRPPSRRPRPLTSGPARAPPPAVAPSAPSRDRPARGAARAPHRPPRRGGAVGHHHGGRERRDPPADEQQQVQGGRVGPVRVLDGGDRTAGGDRVEERREQGVPVTTGRRLPAQRGRARARDVVQRAGRPGGVQRVAESAVHRRGRWQPGAEGPDQRGLPDSCLAGIVGGGPEMGRSSADMGNRYRCPGAAVRATIGIRPTLEELT